MDTCPPSITFTPFITSNKWQPSCQTVTSNSKIILGIELTAFFWIQGMEYDQSGIDIPVDTLLVPIPVLLQSFWLHSSPVTMMAYGSNMNMQQLNNCGPCINGLYLNSRHGLWSIYTSYTIRHTAGTDTCPPSVDLTPFVITDKWCPPSNIWICKSNIQVEHNNHTCSQLWNITA
jgi:hypothetical protein